MYLSIEALAGRWGRSISSIRRDWAAGLIPPPIRLGRRAIRWRIEDVVAWEAARESYVVEPRLPAEEPEESYP